MSETRYLCLSRKHLFAKIDKIEDCDIMKRITNNKVQERTGTERKGGLQQSLPVLTECVQLRSGLERELGQWQESCGLGPAATMRQGLRLIHSRLLAAGPGPASGSNSVSAASEPGVQLVVDIEAGGVLTLIQNYITAFSTILFQMRSTSTRDLKLTEICPIC